MKRVWVVVFAAVLVLLVGTASADVKVSTSKSWHRIQAMDTAEMLIDVEGIPFTKIRFSLKEMTENVELEIIVVTSNDTNVIESMTGEVYEYVRVLHTNIQSSNLRDAIMQFRVTDEWISDSNVDRDSIILYKWEDTSWEALDTTFMREEDNHTYYQVPLDRFSLYAISGEALPPVYLCEDGETNCQDNDLYNCSSDRMSWELLESCEYGCSGGECRTEPSCDPCPGKDVLCDPCDAEPAECNSMLYLAIMAVLIVIVAALAAYIGLKK